MYSELIALGVDGRLYQWRWKDSLPYAGDASCSGSPVYHPRARALGLAEEKIMGISASSIRASVLTESGKVTAIL